MVVKSTNDNEEYALEKLQKSLKEIGFTVKFSDVNSSERNPDFIATKLVGNESYKIAIELKSNPKINEAVTYGVRTLTEIRNSQKFDKLLLLLLHANRNAISNSAGLKKFQLNNPTNLEVISLEELEVWSQKLAEKFSEDEKDDLFFHIRKLSKTMIEFVARNPDNLRKMEWRDLERTLAELFEGLGFDVTLTPGNKDGGKDIILECFIGKIKKSYIIEIKHWRSNQKVGKKAVKEFTKVIINEKREKGLFLSTYGFAENYYESLTEKEKTLIHIGEKQKIVELCRTYEKVNSGIWNPIDSFEHVLFSNTIMPS